MTFSILPKSLVDSVAEPIRQYCIDRYGKNGLKCESGIQANLNWSPTLQVKRSKLELIGIEVSESLYPAILKIAAHDIKQDCPNIPVTVYVACHLDTYLADPNHTNVRKLKEHGFGLLTVDNTGHVTEQFGAIPLIHHYGESELNENIKSLPPSIKVKCKEAYSIYKTSSYQGLQDASQVVEGLVFCLAKASERKGWINTIKAKAPAAGVVDLLYESQSPELIAQRAALGKARYHFNTYRNMASHSPKNQKDAVSKFKHCKQGFADALETATELCVALKKLGITAKIYYP